MVDLLKRILSPEYLAVSQPGPLEGAWPLYLLLAFLLAAGLPAAATILIRSRGRPDSPATRAWAWTMIGLCLAGLLSIAGRLGSWPGWSARAWPLALAGVATAGALAFIFRSAPLPPWLAEQLAILALRPLPADSAGEGGGATLAAVRGGQPDVAWFLAGAAGHLAGIGGVIRARYGLPLWLATLLLAALLLPQLPSAVRGRRVRLIALTPLLGVYAATGVWWLYEQLGITVVGWQGQAFPNPFLSFFYLDGLILAGVAYSILCNLAIMSTSNRRGGAAWRWAAAGLLTVTLVWAGAVYLGKRTHGITASDPYAYAQMAVDLARRGTFLHRFPLFQQVLPLNIPWAPVLPVGYHLPLNSLGDSPSVWATGGSALLAAGYILLGETGLYVTTPVTALLALGATWALANEVLRRERASIRILTATLTLALLATSPEYLDRLLVPMADAAALLFTALTLYCALAGQRRIEAGESRGHILLLLAGLSFGWAYWVRHTQLVLALPLLLVVLGIYRRRGLRRALHAGLLLAGGALLAALPDIAYRWSAFGGPLATETTELPAMRLRYLPQVTAQLLREALVAGEWGYLFPLSLYGGYSLLRRHRREALVLGAALGAILVVHLTYRFLRLRDLMSIFPLINLAVAYGAVNLVHTLRRRLAAVRGRVRLGGALLPAVATAWVVLSLALARWAMIDDLWLPGWASFGYVDAAQRAAFDRLADVTPAEAVIAASLNAGAVTLHTGRDAVRPYDGWSDQQWDTFVAAMRARKRPIYLLDDGDRMASFVKGQAGRYGVSQVSELDLPLFAAPGRDAAVLYRLEGGR